ncbi:MAG TPA: D-glycerate dehydrogenase [Terriglobia bacterium]|nr:D-glycerate dehydrogenase [Terriglobia bacterium]
MKPKVFVTRPVGDEALALLATRCEVASNPHDASMPWAELASALREVEGLMLAGARLTAELMEQAPGLRAISNVGVGYDHLDLAACTVRRIPVTTTVGVVEETTADLAFALLLAAARRVVEGDRYVREGHWQRWQWGLLWGAEVHGKTLGLYGFGHIGQAMARRARGFGMRILYHARHRVAEAVERELGAEFATLDALLAQSDFVSLHVPLTPETRHCVGAPELARMKPTAFLINTARGAVVDEEALVEALGRGRLGGAGLDVFEKEPHVHPTLLCLPGVVLAPHVGSGTAETRAAMARVAARNLLDLLDGKRPATLLNPEVFER